MSSHPLEHRDARVLRINALITIENLIEGKVYFFLTSQRLIVKRNPLQRRQGGLWELPLTARQDQFFHSSKFDEKMLGLG